MSDSPHLIPETSASPPPPNQKDFSSSCPFCVIAANYQPISPHSAVSSSSTSVAELDPEKVDPASFVLFSSEHVIAFLDILPLTAGHVLVAPRKHRVKVGDLSPDESAEIGRVLPLLARSVMKAVLPDIPHEEVDYNVVQNNGPGAAQVVPHVHFHIVPRPPLNYKHYAPPTAVPVFNNPAKTTKKKSKYPPNPVPEGRNRTAILFGRGMRSELDDEEAAVVVEGMRRAVRDEWEATFGPPAAATIASGGGDVVAGASESDHSNRRKGGWKV